MAADLSVIDSWKSATVLWPDHNGDDRSRASRSYKTSAMAPPPFSNGCTGKTTWPAKSVTNFDQGDMPGPLMLDSADQPTWAASVAVSMLPQLRLHRSWTGPTTQISVHREAVAAVTHYTENDYHLVRQGMKYFRDWCLGQEIFRSGLGGY